MKKGVVLFFGIVFLISVLFFVSSEFVYLNNPTNASTTTVAANWFNGTFVDSDGVANTTLYVWNSSSLVGTNFSSFVSGGVSTLLIINQSNIFADVLITTDTGPYNGMGSQIKANISGIPAGVTINYASFCGYINFPSESGPFNFVVKYVTDQQWTEATVVGTLNGQTRQNSSSETLSNYSTGNYACVNVTRQLKQAIASSNSNFTIYLEQAGFEPVFNNVYNGSGLGVGFESGGSADYYNFNDRESVSNTPYFNVSYTTALSYPTTASKNLSFTLPRTGTYLWNYLEIDSLNNMNFNATNWSLIYSDSDTALPVFTGIASNSTITYGQGISIGFNASDNVAVDRLFINQTTHFTMNRSGWLTNSSPLGVGTYILNVSVNDTSNNINSSFWQVIVNQATSSCTLTATNVSYPQNASASGSCTSTDLAGGIFLDGISVSNPYALRLGAGTYNFTLNVSSSQNFTGSVDSIIMNVSANNSYILALAITPGQSIVYGQTTTATGSLCPSELTCTLRRDNNAVTNPEAIVLGVGSYLYNYSSAGNANYSSANANRTLTISINNTPVVGMYVNQSRSNLTIVLGTTILLNVSLQAGEFGTLNLTENGTQLNYTSSNIAMSRTFSSLGNFRMIANYSGNTNYTFKEESWNITVIAVPDTTAPSIVSFIDPSIANSSNLSQTSIPVNVSVTDNIAISGIRIYLYNSSRNIVNNTNFSSSPSFVNFTDLADGIYYVNVTANDSSDNLNYSETRTFTLDTTIPRNISFVYPTNNSGTNLSVNYIRFNISVTDTNFKNVTVYIYNTSGLINTSSSTSSPFLGNFTNLNDDIYYLNSSTYDYAGNSNYSATRTITVAVNGPVISLDSPSDGSSSTSTSRNFTFTVRDSVEISSCSLYIDGNLTNILSSISRTGDNGMYNSSFSVASHNWSVNCTDVLGTTTNSSTRTFSVTAPAASSDDSDSGGSSGGSPTLTASESQLKSGESVSLNTGWKVKFNVAGSSHSLTLKSVSSSSATIEIASTPQIAVLNVGQIRKFDINSDGYYDLSVHLKSITGLKADFALTSINEKIISSNTDTPVQNNEVVNEESSDSKTIVNQDSKNSLPIFTIIIVLLVIGLVVFGAISYKKAHRRKHYGY